MSGRSNPCLLPVLELALAGVTGEAVPRIEIEVSIDPKTGAMSDGGLAAAGAILVVRLASELGQHLGVTEADIIRSLHVECQVDQVFDPATDRLAPLGYETG